MLAELQQRSHDRSHAGSVKMHLSYVSASRASHKYLAVCLQCTDHSNTTAIHCQKYAVVVTDNTAEPSVVLPIACSPRQHSTCAWGTMATYPQDRLKDSPLNDDGQTGGGSHEEKALQLVGLVLDLSIHGNHQGQNEANKTSDATPCCGCCTAQVNAWTCPC